MNLEGKTILITGGGSGIGLELARRLAVANRVVIGGRDEAKLERARAETPSLRTLSLDVTSEEEAQRAVAWLSSELGGLDFLVNNAGLLRGYALSSPGCETNAVEDVEVNLLGAVRMVPKLSASAVADAIVTGLQQDREEIRVGRVRQLAPLARLSPRLADRIVTRALTPLRNL